ncbi:hypothetical protein [Spongiivirga citrea]|uniref:Uncharacterized protein n=1 Tax=Spongiivirga citrea TaxID=1481457 RepID=A0A6M0CLM7_9FLAO|nr:hypothetical protein [Spongiivirga citrea]NER16904.1 hypothetical protein [Spongiivirga citrea]
MKTIKRATAIVLLSLFAYSCTPENANNDVDLYENADVEATEGEDPEEPKKD